MLSMGVLTAAGGASATFCGCLSAATDALVGLEGAPDEITAAPPPPELFLWLI